MIGGDLDRGKVNDGVCVSYKSSNFCVRKRAPNRTGAKIKEIEFSRQVRMCRIGYLLIEMIQ